VVTEAAVATTKKRAIGITTTAAAEILKQNAGEGIDVSLLFLFFLTFNYL
jgi:hypothetical protein